MVKDKVIQQTANTLKLANILWKAIPKARNAYERISEIWIIKIWATPPWISVTPWSYPSLIRIELDSTKLDRVNRSHDECSYVHRAEELALALNERRARGWDSGNARRIFKIYQ